MTSYHAATTLYDGKLFDVYCSTWTCGQHGNQHIHTVHETDRGALNLMGSIWREACEHGEMVVGSDPAVRVTITPLSGSNQTVSMYTLQTPYMLCTYLAADAGVVLPEETVQTWVKLLSSTTVANEQEVREEAERATHVSRGPRFLAVLTPSTDAVTPFFHPSTEFAGYVAYWIAASIFDQAGKARKPKQMTPMVQFVTKTKKNTKRR